MRPVFLLLGVLAGLPAADAAAQDALAGKRLYLDAARLRGSGVSCVDCHGGLPGGAFGIGRSANDPAAVERAINAVPQMTPFRGRLGSTDYADLAAYIGQPDVASPVIRATTLGAAARGAERLQFDGQPLGTDSAPSRWILANDGTVPLRLTSAPQLRGEHAADFRIVATDCAPNRVLVAGAACGVDVVFRPTQPGARRAALAVAHDWTGGESALALTGEGAVAPAATAAPIGGGGVGGLWVAALLVICGARCRTGVTNGRQAARPDEESRAPWIAQSRSTSCSCARATRRVRSSPRPR